MKTTLNRPFRPAQSRPHRPWTPFNSRAVALGRRRESWGAMHGQKGFSLIESLIGATIFLVGVLGVMSLQAVSIRTVSDSRYRAEAALLADEIIGLMWADARANLSTYAHKATGGSCAPSGSASSNARVTKWLSRVGGSLPGATSATQQIAVDAATNKVTVTVCWQAPQDTAMRSHVAVAQIQG